MEFRHNRLIILALAANAVAALSLLCSAPSSAAGGRSASGREDADSLRNKVSFAYDVNFETLFDNREFDKGGNAFARSMTVFGARLTPTVGIDILERPRAASSTAVPSTAASGPSATATSAHGTSGRKAGSRESTASHHRIMLGIDIRKDFGADPVSKLVSRHYRGNTDPEIADALQEETDRKLANWNLFGDIVLYYDFSTQVRKCEVGLKAGVFPRRFLGGEYGEYVFSDSLKFCDPNIEGVLVSFRRPKSYYELGCDWMGQQGTIRREKFMIFTAGYADLTRWLKLGYAGYMLHYASSRTAIGVFDNILVNPYVDMNFGAFCGAQRLALNVGWIQTLQRDRRDNSSFSFPCAADVVLEARHWDVGIRNEFVVGTNLQPWYNDRDKAGIGYGANLYPGDPFYRIIPDSVAAPLTLTEDGKEVSNPVWGTYDRLDVYYAPNFSEYLKLAVTARFHFAGGRYHGCQQMLSLKFDLESLLAGRCQARRHR